MRIAILKTNICVLLTSLCVVGVSMAHAGQSTPNTQQEKKDSVHLVGVLVEGGAECQRFRASDGKYYTLEGDLRGFRNGDAVEITGVVLLRSHCGQDTPVGIETIRRAEPKPSNVSP